MERIKVDSSNIISVGYDAVAQVLELEFNNGIYYYKNVPRKTYRKLMKAPSIGKFFHSEIKPKFEYEKGEFKRMNLPNIYICGPAGSGKTYVAKYLIEKCNYQQAKFANPVYGLARNYFGMQNKDRKLLQTIGTDAGRDTIDNDIWVKRFVEDIQIVLVTRKLLKLSEVRFVCDDVRFPNEHEILQESGWVGIYLNVPDEIREERLKKRDGDSQKTTLKHKSETSLKSFKDELIQIDSSGTLEQTYKQIDDLLEGLEGINQ